MDKDSDEYLVISDEQDNLNSEENSSNSDINISYDGSYEFDWQILGMDCPDCAMKAKKAISRLPGIKQCNISVSEGTVSIVQDISKGNISRTSSVLESLGHQSVAVWQRIVGSNPKKLTSIHNITNKTLKEWILGIPGILDVKLSDNKIEIKKLWIKDLELRKSSEDGLSKIFGSNFETMISEESKFRQDQIQLLSATLTIPIIFIILLFDSINSIPSFISSILGLVGIIFAGYSMFLEAYSGLKNRIIGFQVLTSFAVLGAILLNEWIEALMVVTLVAFSSHLENRALIRARESMQGGLDRIPRNARVVVKSGEMKINHKSLNISQSNSDLGRMYCQDEDMIPIEAIEIGELVEVRSGEKIPVDGEIIEGTGAINRAPLTGEPIPIPVKEGDLVEAGLVLVRGPLIIKSQATGSETRLSSIVELVRHYKEKPTKTQSIIENFTAYWTPIVLLLAPVISILFTSSTEQAILTTLLLWVVSCPCSLLLASPVPHAAALSTASSLGLIARGGDILESAAEIKLAILDKTGTLTSGIPTISDITMVQGVDEQKILQLSSGLEIRSNHPYARTILDETSKRNLKPSKISSISDGNAGVSGKYGTKQVVLGRADWLKSLGIKFPRIINQSLKSTKKAGKGASVLAIDGEAVATFEFSHDDAREGVKETLEKLQSQGIQVEILSGDEQASVEEFAKTVDIKPSICKGNINPEQKAIYVSKKSADIPTLMVGDGINDAGALAAADIGVAMGSGEQVNMDAADILIPGQDPRILSKLVELSKRTKKVVYVNIMISVLVTCVLVLTVLSGFELNLAAGIALHEASAIIIIINGMWVSGSDSARFSTFIELFRDLFTDLIIIFNILFGKEELDKTTTS
ncbi:MAG: hypothetical protein CL993_03075 [Euryarchaeota archaeon]|nr:hypothetical protein [Euryarchaeota archaeon]